MNRRPSPQTDLLRALTGSAALVASLGALSAGCGGDPETSGSGTTTETTSSATDTCHDHVSSSLWMSRIQGKQGNAVDLVLAVDNSRSMADKQLILSLAVPDLVKGLVNPPCISKATGEIDSTPAGALEA